MPVLKNPKHELFAAAVAAGKNAREAAEEAGIEFVKANGSPPFYVYALIDPRSWSVFYVGKGQNFRHAAHFAEFRRGNVVNLKKHLTIEQITLAGHAPFELIVQDQMTEAAALEAETSMIRTIGLKTLTNFSAGSSSPEYRDAAWAQERLNRIIPFVLWVVQRPRSRRDIMLYFRLKYAFWKIANRNHIGFLSVEISYARAR